MAMPSSEQIRLYRFGHLEMEQSFVFTFFPLVVLVLVVSFIQGRKTRQELPKGLIDPDKKYGQNEKQDPEIIHQDPLTPIQNFDIHTQEKEVFRPFKPKYHMSMGLEKCPPNDFILLDKHYVERVKLREQIVEKDQDKVLSTSPAILPGLYEFYTYLLGTHLPTRFPQYFVADKAISTFTNLLNQKIFPLEPPKTNNGVDAMKILAVTIEEDLLMLTKNEDGNYVLTGFVACFPAGFDTSKKFGLTLREIHGPVPLYKEKIALSMDRFFTKLEVGKWVKRLNWSVATTDKLFLPIGNHHYEGEEEEEPLTEIDLMKNYLRVERQVLLRLPESRALIFSVKTYLTPLTELKNEGLGEDFATAIEGLPESVGSYKRRAYWGEALKKAMREE